MPLLEVENLSVDISVPSGTLHAVRDVSLSVGSGETLCLVGESGCGKSLTSLAIMGLLPSSAVRTASRLSFDGTDIRAASPGTLRDMRGRDMSMIFQEPMTCLNACLTIGEQLMEVFHRHRRGEGRAEARERALFLLDKVGISRPTERLSQYPHEFSGGMRQRVMIAMALMCNPRLIIADEPTTALDVTIQAQILKLLQDLQEEFGLALLLITHDLGVVSHIAHRVGVMYAGQVVEAGTAEDIFGRPSHPYTRGLLACVPGVSSHARGTKLGSIPGQVPNLLHDLRGCGFRNRCSFAVPDCANPILPKSATVPSHQYRCILPPFAPPTIVIDASREAPIDHAPLRSQSDIVLEARNVTQTYHASSSFFGKSRSVLAVNDVSLAIHAGEIVAIVGESGCGKSTLAMMLLGLLPPTSGEVRLMGRPLSTLKRHEGPRQMQPVFQDPYASLNPRRSIEAIVAEPLHVQRIGSSAERERRVLEILDAVGLPLRLRKAYPAQLSGGQRQRVAIARALIMKPQILICDEPTSALDVSVQAQVLNLLMDLHAEFNLTYVVISHNLAVVEHVASRVCVMHGGHIVEEGATESIFREPNHPYTRTLLSSILTPDRANDPNRTGESLSARWHAERQDFAPTTPPLSVIST
ncbi:dipeptide ABC transporter ATP-binding protein [Pseudorhodoplanes sp.]|uniref:ABC transporter ATP-binding protein n=1 Tax=Pseudorhodoplanes sp. TaxID=1934341 RepID=UPI003D0FD4DC